MRGAAGVDQLHAECCASQRTMPCCQPLEHGLVGCSERNQDNQDVDDLESGAKNWEEGFVSGLADFLYSGRLDLTTTDVDCCALASCPIKPCGPLP